MPMDVHPLVVHFPIALALTAFALDWGRWFLDRRRLTEAGFWSGTTPILIIALIGAVISVVSGLMSEETIEQTATVAALLETHELLAFISTGGLALLTFWRVGLRGMFPRSNVWVYLLLSLVVATTVAIGGYYGGLMVHVHGTG
ncbi:MAG: hypothetical protein Kow0074_16260 [Candidatus Zixiibacteriota bacterium]